ncbi:MAG: YjbQ family protein [Euryarchaeota archaeon]|nr:YjbQ family protein [Euryarchaeota archaeon]
MSAEIKLRTKGEGDVRDITADAAKAVSDSKVKDGIATIFVVGSTAAITTLEFEPGLVADMRGAAERLFPKGIEYEHHRRWDDGNGRSHVRAAFVGPSVTIPIVKGRLALGTWQQIILLEYDVRPRERTVVVQVVGR